MAIKYIKGAAGKGAEVLETLKSIDSNCMVGRFPEVVFEDENMVFRVVNGRIAMMEATPDILDLLEEVGEELTVPETATTPMTKEEKDMVNRVCNFLEPRAEDNIYEVIREMRCMCNFVRCCECKHFNGGNKSEQCSEKNYRDTEVHSCTDFERQE